MGQPSYAGYGMGDYSYSSHGTTSEEDGKAAADEERDRHKKTKKREDPAPPSEAEFRLQRLRARVMQKAEQAMDDRTPGKDGDLSSM